MVPLTYFLWYSIPVRTIAQWFEPIRTPILSPRNTRNIFRAGAAIFDFSSKQPNNTIQNRQCYLPVFSLILCSMEGEDDVFEIENILESSVKKVSGFIMHLKT
jgi:hypothetical protein